MFGLGKRRYAPEEVGAGLMKLSIVKPEEEDLSALSALGEEQLESVRFALLPLRTFASLAAAQAAKFPKRVAEAYWVFLGELVDPRGVMPETRLGSGENPAALIKGLKVLVDEYQDVAFLWGTPDLPVGQGPVFFREVGKTFGKHCGMEREPTVAALGAMSFSESFRLALDFVTSVRLAPDDKARYAFETLRDQQLRRWGQQS